MADGRGGPRTPSPNTNYPNRSDMASQPVQTNRGQPYGQASAQAQAQKVVPVAGPATSSTPQSASAIEPGMQPGQVPTLQDPSAYPSEPVTAGLPTGAGVGPGALRGGSFGPPSLSLLRAVYAKYPDEDIRRLIELTESTL